MIRFSLLTQVYLSTKLDEICIAFYNGQFSHLKIFSKAIIILINLHSPEITQC